jgi:hypothetical protein
MPDHTALNVEYVTGRVPGRNSCVWDKEELYTCDPSRARISGPTTSTCFNLRPISVIHV